MEKVTVLLPDNSQLPVDSGTTAGQVAAILGPRLAKAAVVALVNESLVDLNQTLEDGDQVAIVTGETETGLEVLRHSAAHVMADAVLQLFPDAKLGIGPAIEEGFYYDFGLPRSLTPDDLASVEQKMAQIIKEDHPFERQEMTKEEAAKLFADQPYKLELIEDLPEETVTVYREGGFVDLCRGPHVQSTGRIKAFKLLSLAGAYWRGDEKRPMLQRIYGTAFDSAKELEEFLKRREEAEKRDHRRLGRELDLFSIDELVGAGLPLWHPKGALMRKIIEDFWRNEHLKRGYELVMTPHIARVDLWKTSGHWDFYRESMFSPMEVEGSPYVVKPMNCPFHIRIYKGQTRSYRELPIRWAELGTVYRFERSGVLHGLLRVRGFTQDDAHIFCEVAQIEDEVVSAIKFALFMLKTFGFEEYDVYLSTQPAHFVGAQENWEKATGALKNALEKVGLSYQIDPGEGVFYGPKIDLKIKDSIGRSWQCTTIQVDFNIPERFDMTYAGADNKEHRPIMIHRAMLGSIERFMGCLIEHYAGAFPVWLSPVQVIVLPIADRHVEYAREVAVRLREAGARVEVNERSESVNRKIRDGQLQRLPYMLVVGDREAEKKQVAVRDRTGDRGPMPLEDFIAKLQPELRIPIPEE